MTQTDLKEKYMKIIRTEVWPSSTRMQEYSEKEFYYGVELANGDIYVIQRPEIKKDFCFGYGMNGICDDEDMDRAGNMAHHAATNEEYFIKQNLEEFDRKISLLMDSRYVGYKYCAYSGQKHGSKLKTYTMSHLCDGPEYNPSHWNRLVDVERLTEDEIRALIDGYGVAKGMFTKRLNTYLKRYGLSKVNTWTYLRD